MNEISMQPRFGKDLGHSNSRTFAALCNANFALFNRRGVIPRSNNIIPDLPKCEVFSISLTFTATKKIDDRAGEKRKKKMLQARNLFDENDNFGFFLFIPSSFLISNGDDAKSGKGVICDDFYVRDVSLSVSLSLDAKLIVAF